MKNFSSDSLSMKTAVESFQDHERELSPPSTPGHAATPKSSPEGAWLLKLQFPHFLFHITGSFQELLSLYISRNWTISKLRFENILRYTRVHVLPHSERFKALFSYVRYAVWTSKGIRRRRATESRGCRRSWTAFAIGSPHETRGRPQEVLTVQLWKSARKT